jgi:hypothetical protein
MRCCPPAAANKSHPSTMQPDATGPAEMAAQPADPQGRSCNHGVQGTPSPAVVSSEIGDFAGTLSSQVEPDALTRQLPARPACSHIHSSGTLVQVFTDCSPAWRVGDFLFASHTLCLPDALPMWLLCALTCSPSLQLPQSTRTSPTVPSSRAVPDASSPGRSPVDLTHSLGLLW